MSSGARKNSLLEFVSSLTVATAISAAIGIMFTQRRTAGNGSAHAVSADVDHFAQSDVSDSTACAKTRWAAWSIAFVVCLGVAAYSGWVRQPLQLRLDPAVAAELEKIRLMPNRISGAPPEVDFALGQPYENTSYNLGQGKRLYSWFGCAACHGDGRGANGPSFLDGWSLYGPEMVSIVSSIRDGRPHGMPSFRTKMTIEQIWQLAGYIQTMGAYKSKVTAPSRNDSKYTRPAENRVPASIIFEPGPVGANRDQGPTP